MKFRTKILLSTVLLLALSFGVGGSLLLSLSFSGVLSQQKAAALASYRMVQSTLSLVNTVSDQTGEEDVIDVLRQMDQRGAGSWVTLRVSGADSVVYQSDYQAASLLLELQEETQPEQGVMQLFARGEARYLQVTSQFLLGAETYYLDGLYDMSEAYRLRESQQEIYVRVFWSVVILGGALAWVLAGLLTRPLRRLSRTTRALAEGRLDSRCGLRGRDEVADLSRDFDAMADSIQDSMNQLQEAMRRQEEFMGSFAHELKTPMTSIIGYADLIRSQSLTGEELREAANYIFHEGTRLEHLSLKLLDLLVLGRDDFPMTEVELTALARQIKEAMAPVLEGQQVQLHVYCKPGRCRMEPELVKSLVLNLLDNGRKALEGGGTLSLSLGPTAEGCLIQVLDNGRGIPKEEIQRLTEAFYRVDKSRSRAQGGAGLGLALCREIVRVHQGAMEFQSEPGRGTLVTVKLRGGEEPCPEKKPSC
ncbi:MAG: sensor histidine kinase [Candidatus Onthomonas sp.]